MKITGKSKYAEARDALLALMKARSFMGNKLPSEDTLAKTLGISVATVREALRQLNREGFITKRHGSGNYMHPSALKLGMRIDITKSFEELLQGSYAKTYVEQSIFSVEVCPQDVVKSLQLHEQEPCLVYDRLYYVEDGKLAIAARNYLPTRYLRQAADDLEGNHEQVSLMEFVWAHCLDEMVQTIVKMEPVLSKRCAIEGMNLEEDSAIYQWEEVFYNVLDQPIGLTKAWFHPGLVEMHLLIKW